MKKVLIFGVGGFVGSYLAAEFKKHGYDVYGSDMNGYDMADDASRRDSICCF